MKRAQLKGKRKGTRAADGLMNEDFAWLGAIHQALSPYWSARSGYAGW